jgi:hypothetical protein
MSTDRCVQAVHHVLSRKLADSELANLSFGMLYTPSADRPNNKTFVSATTRLQPPLRYQPLRAQMQKSALPGSRVSNRVSMDVEMRVLLATITEL